jgi:hypothetical protein
MDGQALQEMQAKRVLSRPNQLTFLKNTAFFLALCHQMAEVFVFFAP